MSEPIVIPTSGSGKSIGKSLYWIALVAIFVWAIWQRFSLPLVPIADGDTWGYLSPALSKLTGGQFIHAESRNFLYPAFLLSVLRLFGDFRAITIVQHLFGLGAGVMAVLSWRRTAAFLPQSLVSRSIHEVLGLVFVTIVLLAGEPIRAEMGIRPEGISGFVLSLNLYFAIEFIARVFVVHDRPALAFGIGTGLTAFVLASLKPSFVLLALVPLLPLGLFFFTREPLRRKIILGLALVTGAIVLFLPEYLLSRDDELAHAFLPTTLFTTHAGFIRDQMADDLEHEARVPYARDRLTRIYERLVVEIAKSARDERFYPTLGYSPEYLMYQESSIAVAIAAEFNDDMAAVEAFYRFYYWRTWRHRPVAMAKKVVGEMALFYAPICSAYDREKYVALAPLYRQALRCHERFSRNEAWKKYPPAEALAQRTAAMAEPAPAIEQSKFVRRIVVFLAVAYLPLLGISIALAIVAWIARQHGGRLRWFAALTLFVFAYNAAACFETAVLHSLYIPRYGTIQFYFTVLAEFLALRLLLETLFAVAAPVRLRMTNSRR
jgi:hypothetical protein